MNAPLTHGGLLALAMSLALPAVQAAETDSVPTSYSPVVITERFDAIMQRMAGDKAGVMQRHRELLEQRCISWASSRRCWISRQHPS
ncbi:hypothetical protein [Stutzerimonas degradans]|uniref:hypothetical protein n=1 Tax=Stutzerimonas degradans TaxID=2968968 RepID=UPI001423567D|nr:hypothetical protein [Stutzerimonas degradans]NHW02649.1 hypothetical protein [Stutzerimonas degradans]